MPGRMRLSDAGCGDPAGTENATESVRAAFIRNSSELRNKEAARILLIYSVVLRFVFVMFRYLNFIVKLKLPLKKKN